MSTSLYNNFRSGSLDIDLDDLVQRNLTNKAIKTEVQQQQHQHQHQHQEQDHMEVENEKGAYYISGRLEMKYNTVCYTSKKSNAKQI